MRIQKIILRNILEALYSRQLLKKKNAFKSIFQVKSCYTEIKVAEEDLYLLK